MKTLLVMRHAKSDWNAPYGADHDRPLNRRGRGAAREMGVLVRDLDLVPDLVVTSTAVRARDTAELAMEAGAWGSELRLEPGFYGASVSDVIRIVSEMPDVRRLMVVGHQPTWSGLVAALTGETIEVKTATIAVVDLGIQLWGDVEPGGGSLVAVHHPSR
jgi:phosphohistidine phosphatase